MRQRIRRLAGAAALFVSFAAFAADESSLADQQATLSSKAFLDAHPDMKFRTEGFIAYDEGRFEDAWDHFLQAARFADKPAQAMLAEMAWKGLGRPADRVLGYVWADVAAERGYRQFVVLRESYWSSLNTQERDRAIETGPPVMDEYGDALAKARLSTHLRRARWGMISGRPRKDVLVIVPGPSGQQLHIRGHQFYAREFWEPERYHQWVDRLWRDPPAGDVSVGPLEHPPGEK